MGRSTYLIQAWRGIIRWDYDSEKDPRFIITVLKQGGRLLNRLAEGPNVPTMILRPLSEKRFYNKQFTWYEVTFIKNEKGEVTSLIGDGEWGRAEFKKIQ
jgi:hypothetical protein